MHIICFDQPYPPTYGGVIDVFYRIKALHEAEIPIILHIFIYKDRKPQPEMEAMAEKTFYYKRSTGILPNLSPKPYIVESRNSSALLENLCLDNEPILFEGLHTTFFLDSERLQGRKKIVRMHNIEHKYYLALAKSNLLSLRMPYYVVESIKLRLYEKVLRHASLILPISTEDCRELQMRFPQNEVRLMNCFFDDTMTVKDSAESAEPTRYILYHGNLALAENIRAARYLISHYEEIIPEGHKLIIAGRNPPKSLLSSVEEKTGIEIIANPTPDRLETMLMNAHVNLLLTFQETGVKLKLLNTLAKSHGFCVVNRQMLYGTSLRSLCHEANTPHEMRKLIENLLGSNTDEKEYLERRERFRALGFNNLLPLISSVN